MRATIWGRARLPEGHEEVHRFAFELQDGSAAPPIRESVSLRTARVVVAHLQDGNALIQMFRAIVSSVPAKDDELIGQTFEDDFIENGPSDRVSDSAHWLNAER
ncbi:hypothetical protein NK8_67040 (plasmid) [Caballeronia sp. NK8]|uniref:hypothetical protein n=1 Tax=Caballeronia sp. NK8 TaxID=140098 RepID=UPI001BB79DB4|nr:hypothetical protein [Caballeronia sp. NK8]BCQ28514.1 hypothetical protein NK8_67040 [Caballeronia sp. NK8]